MNLCNPYGHLIKFKVDNMQEQLSSLKEEEYESCIVPIVNGDGLINVYNDIGVNFVVDAGKYINVSNNEIINTLKSIKSKTIFLLPNNKNNILTCNLIAKSYEDAKIIVIPTLNPIEGIVAALKFKDTIDDEKNKIRMTNAIKKVHIYAISKAIRDSKIGRLEIHKDDYIIIKNDEILYSYKNEKLAIKKICSLLRRKSILFNLNYVYNYVENKWIMC